MKWLTVPIARKWVETRGKHQQMNGNRCVSLCSIYIHIINIYIYSIYMLQTWYDLLQTRCSTQKHTWFLPGKRSNFHTTFERKIVSLLVTLTGCGLVDGDETKIKKTCFSNRKPSRIWKLCEGMTILVKIILFEAT